MGWFHLERVPEPEVMDAADEVEAYSSAAAQEHLDRLDNTFVAHAVRLLNGRERGTAIDTGTGPGGIVLKLAERLPGWSFVGIDRAPAMLSQARANLAESPTDVANRVKFRVDDGNRLAFPDASFDLVICNSVLHHLQQPKNLLAEMARVAQPSAAILLRDLRRPSRLAYPRHVRLHGRHYSGMMYKLFCDSVLAAYTPSELRGLLAASPLKGAEVFTVGKTHLGLERPFNVQPSSRA